MSEPRVLRAQQATEVDMWIDEQIRNAAKWDNAELLDENQAWTLHRLAAAIYAAGYEEGDRAASSRMRAAAQRRVDRERVASGD